MLNPLNKDIISFKDKDSEYYIDLGVKRIIRITKKELVVIDFINSFIELFLRFV